MRRAFFDRLSAVGKDRGAQRIATLNLSVHSLRQGFSGARRPVLEGAAVNKYGWGLVRATLCVNFRRPANPMTQI